MAKKAGGFGINSSKAAQTQLKTTLRNHIDLSAIADNKANIMLTTNTMVITIGLPLLLSNFGNFPSVIWSVIILAISSVASMIFATLATRPLHMSGFTSLEDVPRKKTNLFFFGNFYKMSYDKYYQGLHEVIENDELLDDSISRDLFFLGKSLGRKYRQLRICYNIFMYGLVLAVLVAVVLLLRLELTSVV